MKKPYISPELDVINLSSCKDFLSDTFDIPEQEQPKEDSEDFKDNASGDLGYTGGTIW